MGALADLYSFIDSKKRALSDAVKNPLDALAQALSKIDEDQKDRINMRDNAYPLPGFKTVLNTPEQIDGFRDRVAEDDLNMAMAGMFVGPGARGALQQLDDAVPIIDNIVVTKPLKPLTEKQFYSQYAQHVDLRGRDGASGATKESILRDGFKKGVNVNAMPPYRGGNPTNVMDVKFAPRKGDVVYLAPKSAWKDKPNGMEIQNGWLPKPHEVVEVTEDYPSMYQQYLKSFSEGS